MDSARHDASYYTGSISSVLHPAAARSNWLSRLRLTASYMLCRTDTPLSGAYTGSAVIQGSRRHGTLLACLLSKVRAEERLLMYLQCRYP